MPGVAGGGCGEGGDLQALIVWGKAEVNLTPFLTPFLIEVLLSVVFVRVGPMLRQ